MYTHRGVESYPFPCKLCPKRFCSKYKFKIHMMRHNNIRNFVCPICGMRKTTNNELKIHLSFHSTELNFPCPSCPAVFKSNSMLE